MRYGLFLFIVSLCRLFSADYDCVFIGSSPIPLIEALYQHYTGKKVLVIEEHEECGGAWKSVNACGVMHVDLGCHQIGADRRLKEFLETYIGCHLVSLDRPTSMENIYTGSGYYFSKGCYELIHNILRIMSRTTIDLWLGSRLDAISIDQQKGEAIIRSGSRIVTAKKIFYTPLSTFELENAIHPASSRLLKYPHLYLLIHDPTEPRFSYIGFNMHGASRAMNLTHFVGLSQSGQHLIVFQVHSEDHLQNGEKLLEELKKRKLIDPSAYILRSDLHIYQLRAGNPPTIPLAHQPYFEKLNTSNITNMTNSVERWKKALPQYVDLFPFGS